MCVLGNSFLHSENRDHPGAEAWIFSKCHFLKRSQGRAAVLGSLLGQARSATLQLCGLGPRFFIRKMGPLAALCNNAITWLAGSMTRHL